MRNIILFLFIAASLFSAETNKMQIIGNGQKVANEFVDKKKLDSNMELCAGLQIETDLVGLSFESDNGIVSKDEKPGFYILYLSADERKVTVLCSGFEPLHIILRNNGIGLEKGGFYKIKVTGDKKKQSDGSGDLQINSEPDGVAFTVDGLPDFKNTTPYKFNKLKSGDWQFHFEARSDYDSKDTILTVVKDKTEKPLIRLVPKFAFVTLTNRMNGQTVLIDGKPLTDYQQTGDKYKLARGAHTISCELDLHADKTEKIDLTPGETQTFDAKQSPAYGIINIQANGCRIAINGKSLGSDSYSLKTKPGKYKITIERDKYYPQTEELDLAIGDNKDFSYTLKPIMGSVSVEAIPLDSKGGGIYINNEYKTDLPGSVPLIIGDYTVSVKHSKYLEAKKSVVIKENQTEKISFNLETYDGSMQSKIDFWRTNKWYSLGTCAVSALAGSYFYLQKNSLYSEYEKATTANEAGNKFDDAQLNANLSGCSYGVSISTLGWGLYSWFMQAKREREYNK